MEKETKNRGRPRTLTDEERRQLKNKRSNEQHKKSGYSSQKRYRQEHKNDYYDARVIMRREFKHALDTLLAHTGMSSAKLFLSAVEEKYGVTLTPHIDEKED